MGCLELVDAPDQEFVEVAQVHYKSELGTYVFLKRRRFASFFSSRSKRIKTTRKVAAVQNSVKRKRKKPGGFTK